MNPTPLACWLLTATLLAAADAPQGDTPPRPTRNRRSNAPSVTGPTPKAAMARPRVSSARTATGLRPSRR